MPLLLTRVPSPPLPQQRGLGPERGFCHLHVVGGPPFSVLGATIIIKLMHSMYVQYCMQYCIRYEPTRTHCSRPTRNPWLASSLKRGRLSSLLRALKRDLARNELVLGTARSAPKARARTPPRQRAPPLRVPAAQNEQRRLQQGGNPAKRVSS